MNWMMLALFSAASFGLYNFFIKISSDKLSPTIALMCIGGSAFAVALVSTIFLKLNGQQLTFSKEALLFPILAGLFTGIAEIFYLIMFTKNVPLSVGNSLVVTVTVVFATILSIIFLKEPMNFVKIAGLAFSIIGVVLLSQGK